MAQGRTGGKGRSVTYLGILRAKCDNLRLLDENNMVRYLRISALGIYTAVI